MQAAVSTCEDRDIGIRSGSKLSDFEYAKNFVPRVKL